MNPMKLPFYYRLINAVFIVNLIGVFSAPVLFARQDLDMLKKLEEEQNPISIPLIERPRVVYDAGNLRDPFLTTFKEEDIVSAEEEASAAGTQETQPVPPPLEVQGIISGPNFSQAIINGKIVKIGDAIENAYIVDIDKEKVEVLFKTRQFTLSSPASNMLQKLQKQKKEGEKNEK